MNSSFDLRIVQIEATHELELDKLRSNANTSRAGDLSDLKAEMATLREEHVTELAAVKSAREAELVELRASHETSMAAATGAGVVSFTILSSTELNLNFS